VLKVTADTNILISGLVFRHGKPAQLLRMALAGEINLTVSRAILDEMADVLARKFGASPEEVAEATAIVKEAARTVTPSVELNLIKDDPPDNRVLECAVSAGADYIVTGDKDLLRLKQYDAIQIKSAGEFLEISKHARGV
jgi:uncharacterized protein